MHLKFIQAFDLIRKRGFTSMESLRKHFKLAIAELASAYTALTDIVTSEGGG